MSELLKEEQRLYELGQTDYQINDKQSRKFKRQVGVKKFLVWLGIYITLGLIIGGVENIIGNLTPSAAGLIVMLNVLLAWLLMRLCIPKSFWEK
jgi:hypothetical protein